MDNTPENNEVRTDPQNEQLLDELEKTTRKIDNISRLITVAQDLAKELDFPSTEDETVDQTASERHRELNKHLDSAWWDNQAIRWTYQKFAELHGRVIM